MLSCCGSLAGEWTALLRAFRCGENVAEAAATFVTSAVPEEGEIHPLRAEFRAPDRGHWVEFTTPGRVVVLITCESARELCLTVDFGRDSVRLASEMLAVVALMCPEQLVLIEDKVWIEAGRMLAILMLQEVGDGLAAAVLWDRAVERSGEMAPQPETTANRPPNQRKVSDVE